MHHVQGMHETDEADVRATYGYLVDSLRPLGLAYLWFAARRPRR